MAALLRLAGSFSAKGYNTIPFRDSWTAGQLVDHLLRSNRSICQALEFPGEQAMRRPDERAPELERIFLDYNTKMQAPDFILPGQDSYDPEESLLAWQASVAQLRAAAAGAELTHCIGHPAFGEITRLELLYFVVYHTRRHTHQLQQIYNIVEQKSYRVLSFLFQPPALFW